MGPLWEELCQLDLVIKLVPSCRTGVVKLQKPIYMFRFPKEQFSISAIFQ